MADDIFKEVDDEVRAERARALARRFAALMVALLLLAAICVGIWQWQSYRQRQRDAAASGAFFEAMRLAQGTAAGASPNGAKASTLFGQVAATAPEGLRTLARLREAQLAWQGGQKPRALGLWAAIRDDADADPVLRGLAGLLWVQHQISDGDPAVLKSALGALSRPDSVWRPMAEELDADLDLRLGHIDDAKRKLTRLSEDGAAPEGLRTRAAGLNDTLEATRTANGRQGG